MSDDKKPSATLPTSTIEHNRRLDAQALRQEQPDERAPWYERWREKFFVTPYSTWRGLFERH
jgi:hypothetical protein